MVMKLVINIAKKIPGLTDYSSVQASCSIEREVGMGEDLLVAAADLQAQAEASVDQQLARRTAPMPASPGMALNLPSLASTANGLARASARPVHPSGRGRRGPTLATPSQLGLLTRLIGSNQPQVIAICEHHHIQQLADLTVAQASEVIDTLKAPR
jgi:hypothetical protein